MLTMNITSKTSREAIAKNKLEESEVVFLRTENYDNSGCQKRLRFLDAKGNKLKTRYFFPVKKVNVEQFKICSGCDDWTVYTKEQLLLDSKVLITNDFQEKTALCCGVSNTIPQHRHWKNEYCSIKQQEKYDIFCQPYYEDYIYFGSEVILLDEYPTEIKVINN